jgi:hypothetical protein
MIDKKKPRQEDTSPSLSMRCARWAGLVGSGVLALVIALSLLQCSLKKPEAPSWNSTLRIPLAADHLDAANLLTRFDDGDQFVDESGNLGLFLADTLDTVALNANLMLPEQSVALPQALGQVRVVAPPGDAGRSDLSGFATGGAVPPFEVFDIDTLGPISEYTWITIAGGEAYIRVTNASGLDFDSVTVWLTDLIGGPVGTYDFAGGISAGQADSLSLGITGRQLYNQFQYQLYAHTPGDTAWAASNPYLDVAFSFSDTLVLDSGLLEVPSVIRSESDIIAFSGNEDLIAIRSADLTDGQLELVIENHTGLVAGVTWAVPSFTLGGTPLSRNIAIQARDTTRVTVPLAGYHWVPEEPGVPQYFVVNAVATTVASAPAHVLVRPSDTVAISARLTGLEAQRVTGVLAPQQITLPTYRENLSIPSELSAFHPAEATLDLEVINGSGASAALAFEVTANNGNSLTLAGIAAGGAPDAPAVSRISEPDLAALLDPFPTLVEIHGHATFGDSASEFTIDAADFAYARVTVSAPLAVRIDSVTIEGDTDAQEISGSDVGEFTDRLEGGSLHLETTNHLPVAARLTLYVARDPDGVYTAPDLVLGPVQVDAGVTDISGIVTDTARSKSELLLTPTDLELFDSPTLHFGYRIFLPGSGGQIVRITSADYLDLVAYFNVTMRNGKGAW